ncbi:MAG: DNA adenine methylase [Metamycoplasmataceae bacterium]
MLEPKTDQKITPMVKWVGGKGSVIKKHLNSLLPKEFNDYYEIFCGAGAMLLHLQPKSGTINDINSELMKTYNVIKNDVYNLMDRLDIYKNNHSETLYYKTRTSLKRKDLEIAARFIYLNKTCFNGMYRVNAKGIFNVPFNGITKEKLNLYNKDNLILLSNYLNKNDIKITNTDYLETLKFPKKGDFIFVDSPYDYEEGLNGFDSYNENGFNRKNQIDLCLRLIELDKDGVKWMVTNHSTKLIKELFKDYKQFKIKTNRSINSNGALRKKTGNEIVIINY